MKLFIDLYCDKDVSVLLSELLKGRGYKALTTRDAKMLGKSDAGQLKFAAKNSYTLLTHNRSDFEKLHEEYIKSSKSHSGIIIAKRRNEYSLLKRLLKILNNIAADEIKQQIRYI